MRTKGKKEEERRRGEEEERDGRMIKRSGTERDG